MDVVPVAVAVARTSVADRRGWWCDDRRLDHGTAATSAASTSTSSARAAGRAAACRAATATHARVRRHAHARKDTRVVRAAAGRRVTARAGGLRLAGPRAPAKD